MRPLAALTIIVAIGTSCFAQDIAAWYPLHPGNTWVYQKESLSGYMAHPDFERWSTEETVVSAAAVPQLAGTLVTIRIKTLDDVLSPNFIAANAHPDVPERYLLIRRNCVYSLDRPWDRDELLRGELAADYCFPIAIETTWGRVPSTSPANEYVWNVMGINDDPFGAPGGNTYHLTSYGGSGTSRDRWFEEGVGLVQEVIEHHGTYDEDRQQLLKATINGQTQSFQLKPARIAAFGEGECNGPGWQHYVRANGTAFASLADCTAWFRTARR